MNQTEIRLQDMVNELSAEVERLKENQMTEYQKNRLQEAEENYFETLNKLEKLDRQHETLKRFNRDMVGEINHLKEQLAARAEENFALRNLVKAHCEEFRLRA